MTRRPLMVLGCTSNAGKSLLVAALCRWFARNGTDVVPFKAQNMSNNARVVAGGEIGVAQWLQARAAGVDPTVDMNPVLCKPEADTRSQVVVHGVARRDVSDLPWIERGPAVWPAMTESFDRLAARHDLVVIEGAGSPAEINLPDLVNRGIVEHADAAAVLVVDIDRGGAFAHLVGTWDLAGDETRNRLKGFVLNKFRGDASLLAPAPDLVAARTGMHPLGVLPMLDHDLPDEEGATIRSSGPADGIRVGIVRYPFSSNLDEWHLMDQVARVGWVTTPVDLDGCDVVVLPGSKHVAADLAWMHRQGLGTAVRRAAAAGARVLGVCGGAMMLGNDISDPEGVEGASVGLGLLDLVTTMRADKTTRSVQGVTGPIAGPWSALSARAVSGYEIRNGAITGSLPEAGPGIWVDRNILATTVHGLFEDAGLVSAVTGRRPEDVLEPTFERLADALDAHLDMERVDAWTRR